MPSSEIEKRARAVSPVFGEILDHTALMVLREAKQKVSQKIRNAELKNNEWEANGKAQRFKEAHEARVANIDKRKEEEAKLIMDIFTRHGKATKTARRPDRNPPTTMKVKKK